MDLGIKISGEKLYFISQAIPFFDPKAEVAVTCVRESIISSAGSHGRFLSPELLKESPSPGAGASAVISNRVLVEVPLASLFSHSFYFGDGTKLGRKTIKKAPDDMFFVQRIKALNTILVFVIYFGLT